jgi:hypothetical protein
MLEQQIKHPKRGSFRHFVLKSEFNPAWTLFNVRELGDIITQHWCSHLVNKYEHERKFCQQNQLPFEDWFWPVPSAAPRDWMSRFLIGSLFDTHKAGLCDRCFLVSRKQTRNMFDLTNTWKRLILSDTFFTHDDFIINELTDQ